MKRYLYDKKDKLLSTIFDECLNDSSLQQKITNNYKRLSRLLSITRDEYEKYVIDQLNNKDLNTLFLYYDNISLNEMYKRLLIDITLQYFKDEWYREFEMVRNYDEMMRFKNSKPFDMISEDGKTIFNCRYINEPNDELFNELIAYNEYSSFDNYIIVGGKYGIERMYEYLGKTHLADGVTVIVINDYDVEEYETASWYSHPNQQIGNGWCEIHYGSIVDQNEERDDHPYKLVMK